MISGLFKFNVNIFNSVSEYNFATALLANYYIDVIRLRRNQLVELELSYIQLLNPARNMAVPNYDACKRSPVPDSIPDIDSDVNWINPTDTISNSKHIANENLELEINNNLKGNPENSTTDARLNLDDDALQEISNITNTNNFFVYQWVSSAYPFTATPKQDQINKRQANFDTHYPITSKKKIPNKKLLENQGIFKVNYNTPTNLQTSENPYKKRKLEKI